MLGAVSRGRSSLPALATLSAQPEQSSSEKEGVYLSAIAIVRALKCKQDHNLHWGQAEFTSMEIAHVASNCTIATRRMVAVMTSCAANCIAYPAWLCDCVVERSIDPTGPFSQHLQSVFVYVYSPRFPASHLCLRTTIIII
eukprot:TRINITY_DN4920_c0_g1_i2.p1 TRINITY_DN4920_c0_g1~~TRINITY_DN4920_c0_g1_i2.p1  ORF type:complete len:141 (-),score=4.62 TRINITY_DN4920_c0_g1_i2:53-475(-)